MPFGLQRQKSFVVNGDYFEKSTSCCSMGQSDPKGKIIFLYYIVHMIEKQDTIQTRVKTDS